MTNNELLQKGHPLAYLTEKLKSKQNKIFDWLSEYEHVKELPLYSSVDIRDAGFKMAVVDTNIFPAGFNNLCEHGFADSVQFIKKAIEKRAPDGKEILIVAEEHTRNTWYLENVRILQKIIKSAGFNVKIATFLSVQPSFCENMNYCELETAIGHKVKIYCFQKILQNIYEGSQEYDLIIMNNDLTNGIPDVLKKSTIPIYPSIQAGWHSRLKSKHFSHAWDLLKQLADILEIDPWLFSCLSSVVDQVNINVAEDRRKLKTSAEILFDKITQKYKEHDIEEKPYIVLKSDSGTYGMGVHSIEDPSEIMNLNRKMRNRLYKGKGSAVINRFILQEGVPTIHNIEDHVSEVCIYQVEQNLVGGFYRSNTLKGQRDNLNSQGMIFKKMCPHLSKYGDCGVHHDINTFDIYRVLARIAAIAAHREILQLEADIK